MDKPSSDEKIQSQNSWATLGNLLRMGLFGVSVFVVVPAFLAMFGRWFWLFDLLAEFRMQYVVLLTAGLVVAMASRAWLFMPAIVLALIVSGLPVALYLASPNFAAPASGESLKIVSFNVYYKNFDFVATTDFVLEEDPDIVAFYEVTEAWQGALEEALGERFAHSDCVARQDSFGICLFSKQPWVQLEIVPLGPLELPTVNATFDVGGSQVQLVAVHPIPPFGSANANARNVQLEQAAALLDKTQPRIMMGDFNLTPFSPTFSEVKNNAKVSNVGQGRGLGRTWVKFPTILGGLKIDHVLASEDIGVTSFSSGPNLGSDHRPIIVELQLSS